MKALSEAEVSRKDTLAAEQRDAWAAYGYEIRTDDVEIDVEIRGNFFDMSKASRELVAAVIDLLESFSE